MRRFGGLLLIALLIAAATARGVHQRLRQRDAQERAVQEPALPAVAVAYPAADPVPPELLLPANIQAFQETPVYARTNGYLKRWNTGMGSRVTAGQILAEIETPEIDQELRQAEAAAAEAAANRDLAEKTDARWQALLQTHSVSRQEAEQFAAQRRARTAELQAAQANVQRLRALQGFRRVTAPFDGLITVRSVDVGSLISAGTGQQLFRIAQAHTLRVYLAVPQSYSRQIRPGMAAHLEISEFPGRSFAGTVASTAGAIDPASRTLNTEVLVDNPGGEILPGAFGRVRLPLEASGETLRIASTSLIFRDPGTQVATVDERNQVHLKPIRLGRDFGATLEVLEGLTRTDRVVVTPPDSLSEGDRVEVVAGTAP